MSKVFVRGLNITAQLNSSRQNVPKFEELPQLRSLKMKDLGCGYLQSMYLLQDNQFLKAGYFMDSLSSMRLIKWYRNLPFIFRGIQKMFFMGKLLSFKEGDEKLTLLNKPQVLKGISYKKAVFSHSSAFLISQANEVFSIGENYFGQLGTNDEISLESNFRLVPEINKNKIVDVACGFQHTVFITENGQLYGCGKAQDFQIQPENLQVNKDGITTVDKIVEPALIWSRTKVKKVACGFKNTIFLTENNKLYAIGSNKYGESGMNYEQSPSFFKATEIYFPKDQEIIDIACGFRHTLILTNNRVYFSGSIQRNQNPFSNFLQNFGSFTEMNLPSRPIKIFAKFDRSAIITENGKAYIFGGVNLSKSGGQSNQLQVLKEFDFKQDSLIGLGFGHTVVYV